jgi:hypothetical protein
LRHAPATRWSHAAGAEVWCGWLKPCTKLRQFSSRGVRLFGSSGVGLPGCVALQLCIAAWIHNGRLGETDVGRFTQHARAVTTTALCTQPATMMAARGLRLVARRVGEQRPQSASLQHASQVCRRHRSLDYAAAPAAALSSSSSSTRSLPLVPAQPLPAWATVNPYTAGLTDTPGECANLLSGAWTSTRIMEDLLDPLTGEVMFRVPATTRSEVSAQSSSCSCCF